MNCVNHPHRQALFVYQGDSICKECYEDIRQKFRQKLFGKPALDQPGETSQTKEQSR